MIISFEKIDDGTFACPKCGERKFFLYVRSLDGGADFNNGLCSNCFPRNEGDPKYFSDLNIIVPDSLEAFKPQ